MKSDLEAHNAYAQALNPSGGDGRAQAAEWWQSREVWVSEGWEYLQRSAGRDRC